MHSDTLHTNTGPLILLIEDEPDIAEILEIYLKREGFRSQYAGDGQLGMQLFRRQRPALVILDIRLPGQNGIDILQTIRAEGTVPVPVIMLTALTDDLNKLLSLRLGADDYISKPFNPAEVIARIHAVLRRTGVNTQPVTAPFQVGQLLIDYDMYGVMVVAQDGIKHPLALTLTEFRLLAFLARQPKRCFSRFDLIESCLPESEALDRVIDSHLSKLRQKLEQAGCLDKIETVRGIGYRLWPAL